MNFAIIYLLNRFLFRLADFFHHWYADGSRFWAHRFVSLLERFDRVLAFRITLKYFFHPLYKDYRFIGRVLGILLRSARIIVAVVIYAGIVSVSAVWFVAWLALPFALFVMAYRTLVLLS